MKRATLITDSVTGLVRTMAAQAAASCDRQVSAQATGQIGAGLQ